MEETLLEKCPRVETERLVLRKWEEQDLGEYIRLNSDPRVTEYYRSAPSPEVCETALKSTLKSQKENGFCFPVVEDKQTGAFLGFCGLSIPDYSEPLPCEPCVEIGWQLFPEVWGKGIAGEAARFWLSFGFDTLQLDEVVAFTVVQNQRSRRVMEKLGMIHNPADDFDFPGTDPDHPLCRNVLYRLSKQRFLEVQND